MTGAPDLKATQVYPPGYGEALFDEWENWSATGQIIDAEGWIFEGTHNLGWGLLDVGNIETFMCGAGFVFDAQNAARLS